MIEVKEEDYIGEGEFQKCYVHPNNKNLCIKIMKPREGVVPRISSETKYYNKIQKKIKVNLNILFLHDITEKK